MGNTSLKILWQSDPPSAPSAYGQQTALFLPHLRAAGYEIILFCGRSGAPQRLADGTLVLPYVADPYGNDVILGHMDATGANVVITLVDPHVLNPDIYKQIPWCAWAPIDCSPAAPDTMKSLRGARWIWSTSKFSKQQVQDAGLEATFMPHGVDSQVFQSMNQTNARKILSAAIKREIKDEFLIAVNAANKSAPSRKGFFEAYSAFKRYLDKHPNSLLYIHTEASGCFGGENLHSIEHLVGLPPSRVLYPPQYQYVCGMLNSQFLAQVYNAADVYLSTSHGEGFGLGAVESMMCGTPVIVPKNSAQEEVGFDVNLMACDAYMPFQGSMWKRPRVSEITHLLETYTAHHVNELQDRAMHYDITKVFTTHMLPALDRIKRDLKE